MYDVTFCVILVTTILSGYYRRDERNAEYLERYNDEFPDEDKIQVELDRVFDFVDRCGLEDGSRAWKQTDLFTLLVELHSALAVGSLPIDPETVGQRLRAFYGQVDKLYQAKRLPADGEIPTGQEQVLQYLKAATKATNDKYARVERAEVISDLIRSTLEGKALAQTAPGRSKQADSTPEPAAPSEPSPVGRIGARPRPAPKKVRKPRE